MSIAELLEYQVQPGAPSTYGCGKTKCPDPTALWWKALIHLRRPMNGGLAIVCHRGCRVFPARLLLELATPFLRVPTNARPHSLGKLGQHAARHSTNASTKSAFNESCAHEGDDDEQEFRTDFRANRNTHME